MIRAKLTAKEIMKYGRMDTHFHLTIKPTVDLFFQTHSVDNKGIIQELNRTSRNIPDLTERQYVLLYSLIKYFIAYQKAREAIKDLSSCLKL